jgi:peptidoglycan/LPS O-acetylase OafA/YrhL
MVLGAHLDLGPDRLSAPAWLERALRQWQTSGWSGVDLFFVLSGFLISSLLFREFAATGRVRIGRFLARRGLKIYPPFWVMILFTVVAALASGHDVASAGLVSELLFVQNYGPTLYGYTWSLAVEEHFYVLLVGLIAWRASRDHDLHRVMQAVLLALPVIFLLRCLYAWQWSIDYQSHIHATHLRLDGLAFGVGLGYLATFHGPALEGWVRRRRWPLLGCGAAVPLAAIDPQTTPWVYTAGFSTIYLGAGALLLLARYGPFNIPHRSVVAPLAWVGANGYAIYLWHVPVRDWGGGLLALGTGQHTPTPAGLLLYVVGAVLFGAFMTRMIERPALAWRDRHFP